MTKKWMTPLAAVPAACLWPAAAGAVDVNLSGVVANVCIVTSTPGTLGLEPGGTALSSQGGGGTPAGVQVTATGTNPRLTFSAPVATTPPGFSGTPDARISYSANGTLLQAETNIASVHLLTQLLNTLSVSGRIVGSDGFAAGPYNLKTVVTCQQ